ncbi:MAG TPA: TldD/PmbA family protein [Candidatus Eisenbacteria bacterium]|nr:TldD/PmbA family protein [Candidatus Eisenbacteria bacterium]
MPAFTPQEILVRVRDHAMRSGAAEVEVYLEIANFTEARVRQTEVEYLVQSAIQGLGFRVFVDRKVGFSYTTDIRPNIVDELVRRTIALASMNSPRDENRLPDEQLPLLENLEIYDPAIEALRPADVIDLARKTEGHAFAADKRVQSTRDARAGFALYEVHFTNTFVPYLTYKSTSCWLGVTAIASDGATRREGAFGDRRRIVADLAIPEVVGRKAAERATARLGAKPVPTTQAPVIFEAGAAATFVAGLVPAISATNALELRSFLGGKHNQVVASPLVTLVDDGIFRRGLGTRPFDGEGVQQRRTVVIDGGTLVKFLNTAATAHRFSVRFTGNAARNYDTLPAVGSTNLYIAAGRTALDKMISETPRGLYVTELTGSGVDTVSGQYSQQAVGRWIEKGALAQPVERVAVSGRLDEMLLGIDSVGRDLEVRNVFSSPSLRFKQLTIAGA